MVLEKTLQSPLDIKEIKPVNPKGNQPLIFIGKTDAEAEAPKLWPPDTKTWLIRKDPDAGKDWGQEEKGVTQNKMVGIINSVDMSLSKFQETSEGQGSPVCSSCGWRQSETTWQLNNNITTLPSLSFFSLNYFSSFLLPPSSSLPLFHFPQIQIINVKKNFCFLNISQYGQLSLPYCQKSLKFPEVSLTHSFFWPCGAACGISVPWPGTQGLKPSQHSEGHPWWLSS